MRYCGKKVPAVFRALLALIALVLAVPTVACRWFGEAEDVAYDEFGPKAMLKKYSWFKDASAELDKKLADIKIYEGRMVAMNETYKNLPRQKWPREDREQYNIWSSELAGVKASYNSLAAEYNSQMVKFNWKFANKGQLPQGATEPLPREYKPYTTQ